MFLREFSKEQQKIYLNLAYALLWSDGEYKDEEKKLFSQYENEVSVDVTDIEKADFSIEIDKLKDITFVQKKKIFMELFLVASIDCEYAPEEKALLKIAKDKFSLTDKDVKSIAGAVNSLVIGLNKIQSVIEGED